jgi:dGTPase
MDTGKKNILQEQRRYLQEREAKLLSPQAAFSKDGVRRSAEEKEDLRLSFSQDVDRVLHSKAYTRYIDKTQVFYMVKNDHITHRVLHVQLVSKIARTIGRYLGLNEDLIEAIALGHDIGHPPFGHDGEKVLSAISREFGLAAFQHNIQSVRFLEKIERGGRGWNLTLQTLDGILCHDGEVHNRELIPRRDKDFAAFDADLDAKQRDSRYELVPMTLEGCVVRFADTIGYIGRDIEDAIELKMISRADIPAECRRILGETNGAIVYRLVEDLISNSVATGRESICFSREVSDILLKLKEFNYEYIYYNPTMKKGFDKIKTCYRVLFHSYLEDIVKEQRESVIFVEFLDRMDESYLADTPVEQQVRDFVAGMTDDYFLDQAAHYGCGVPAKV